MRTDAALPQRPATASSRLLEDVGRPRKNTIEHLERPGSVRINVQGAFIVDEDGASPPRAGSPARYGQDTKDIRLPHHKAEVSHMAVDIGGSLAKLVYFSRDPNGEGGKLNFKNFETERIDDLIDYMDRLVHGERDKSSRTQPLYVMATGGGAYKYFDRIQEKLGVQIYREDEMECLIVGLDFFLTEIPEEVFTYTEEDPMHFTDARTDIYPYLLVNIGSGVSMVKVSGPQKFERVGGSSLGGGTLWGLLSLLTPAKTFDEMLGMAEKGDNTNVDMLVGDIYGGGYEKIGLKATTIASSFGKVFKKQTEAWHQPESSLENGTSSTEVDKASQFAPEDISRSLLYMVSNNIGQIAYLLAEQHGLEHVYFGGSFIRGHHQTMHTLSFGMRYWSKGTKKAYFLRHEGYLGAVGAFLRHQPRNWGRRNSFGESTAVPWNRSGAIGGTVGV
ncbi:fumble-domain-containing protein [Sphaerosporella brunnea]|uniref:Fumble-domain-containing protein n=1 Tax=Sphaerosporella brunnea TaxID=1250544 RepID=A0A5J5ERG8_9PEZI|nr:fumble-domain-containing protein [Sphaerosporella brunnea]